MLYGELGIYPLEIQIKTQIIGYWLKINTSHDNKITKQLYNTLLRFTRNGIYLSRWISYVHVLLLQNGFGYVWLNDFINTDFNTDSFKVDFKERLILQYIQQWQSSVKESRKCVLYKHVKDEIKLEKYILSLPWKFCKYVLKLRLSNHKLSIETGRYLGIDRNLRYCDNCSMDLVGDEYHLVCECNNKEISALRTRFIPPFYRINPSMFKFITMLKCVDKPCIGIKLGKFLMNCKFV